MVKEDGAQQLPEISFLMKKMSVEKMYKFEHIETTLHSENTSGAAGKTFEYNMDIVSRDT